MDVLASLLMQLPSPILLSDMKRSRTQAALVGRIRTGKTGRWHIL